MAVDVLNLKYKKLCKLIKEKKKVVVAFSGGVDSSLLAKTAYMVLGDNMLAVTVDSPTLSESELAAAKNIANEIGVKHMVIWHNELSNKNFTKNPQNRCYFCKKELVGVLRKVSREFGARAILEGTNADEVCGHRPGMRALKEEDVLTPLVEAGLGKKEVRDLAKELGLSNHDKPSMACLSSRIPYNDIITFEKLGRISKSEEYIRGFGVRQVRVRCYGDIACIEVTPSDFQLIVGNRRMIAEKLAGFGFKYVGLDLRGYRCGSMNEFITQSYSSSYSL